jgi:hypothetical protein
MFYKPKYCCNCGEKIERANPSFTDSRRFCDVCKHDFVLHRAVPKIFLVLMAVFGIFGLGSFWRSGEKPLNLSTRQFTQTPSNAGKNPVNQASPVSSDANAWRVSQANNVQSNAPATSNLITKPPKQTGSAALPTEETTYFCGAPTKKGTPCARRVRGGGRCWQHKGQTALPGAEKLPASR